MNNENRQLTGMFQMPDLQKQLHQQIAARLDQITQLTEEEVVTAFGRDLGMFRQELLDFVARLRQLWVEKASKNLL